MNPTPPLLGAFLSLFALACTCEGQKVCAVRSSQDSGAAPRDTGSGIDCAAQSMASSRVFVQDTNGHVLRASGIAASYSVDGGEFVACEPYPDMPDYICGRDETGAFVVRAEADEHGTQEVEFLVELDELGCNVVTHLIEIQLEPVVSSEGR